MTSVIVPPGIWHPIHTTGEPPEPNKPDGRMVTECYHANPGNIMLTVRDDGTVTHGNEPPPCSYITRTIPYEDHAYQQFVQMHRPAP